MEWAPRSYVKCRQYGSVTDQQRCRHNGDSGTASPMLHTSFKEGKGGDRVKHTVIENNLENKFVVDIYLDLIR